MTGGLRRRIRFKSGLAFILVLVSGLALAYFGFQSLAEKESSLRTGYTATAVLVRDRLAAEVTRLESESGASTNQLREMLDDRSAVHAWLDHFGENRPWLANPFVVRDNGVATSRLEAGWRKAPHDPALHLRIRTLIAEAEAAEFKDGNFIRALELYRAAQMAASSEGARRLTHARVGRTLFKLRRFEDGISEYQAIRTIGGDAIDSHGIPYAVIALSQIADGFEVLGRPKQHAQPKQQLLRYVIDHPWDVADGYRYYLNSALADAGDGISALAEKAHALSQDVARIEWIRDRVVPHLRSESRPLAREPVAGRLVLERDGRSILIGYQPLAGIESVSVGYEILPSYVAGPLLRHVLDGVDLGADLRVAVQDHPSRTATNAGPEVAPSLATATFSDVLPDWSVGLFDRRGRSLEQLVIRERGIYGGLITGMFIVLLAGMFLSARAATREAELSQLRTDFVSNVSHELKTPLALIRMFGETLESGIVDDPNQRQEFSAIIRRESERLTHLINNVLDAARIDAGTKLYSPADADVVSLVRNAVDAYRPFFDRLGFRVEISLPEKRVLARVDQDALAQVLVNLFQNAIKYSDHTKAVTVAVSEGDGDVRVSVADRGIGIPSEQLSRIFDKYYRISASASHGATGSGLGLCIVKHALEAHGGRVDVESTVGRGSVFTLVLPSLQSTSAS